MKFTLKDTQFAEFSKNLFLLMRVSGMKNGLVKVVCDSGELKLSSYGQLGKLQLCESLDIKSTINGAVVIKDDFVRLIKNLTVPKSETVTFSLGSNNAISIKISGSKSKYSVKCLSSDTMSDIDFGEYASSVSVDSSDLAKGLNVKLFCKTDTDTSDVFSCINMMVTNNSIKFIGSDAATVVDITYNAKSEEEFSLLIPNQISGIIQSILSSSDNVLKFGPTSTGHGLIITSKCKYLFSTHTGKYPDVSTIVRSSHKNPIIVDNQNFLEKLVLVSNLSSIKVVHITIADGIIIKNTDTDIIDIEEYVPSTGDNPCTFYAGLKHLIVFLAQFKSSNADVALHVDKRFLVRSETGRVSYTLVTTPINIKQ